MSDATGGVPLNGNGNGNGQHGLTFKWLVGILLSLVGFLFSLVLIDLRGMAHDNALANAQNARSSAENAKAIAVQAVTDAKLTEMLAIAKEDRTDMKVEMRRSADRSEAQIEALKEKLSEDNR